MYENKNPNFVNFAFTSLIGAAVIAVVICIVNNFYDSDIKKKQKEVFYVSIVGAFVVLFVVAMVAYKRMGDMSKRDCMNLCGAFPMIAGTDYVM